jgi:peptidyl-dipeptidase Dcp
MIKMKKIVFLFILFIKIHTSMAIQINPLLEEFDTPYKTVPFDKIKPAHFEPAFKVKIGEAKKEFKALLANKEKPTFQNTLLPVEKKYDTLSRMGLILFNLNSAETNKELQAVTRKVSPMLTRFTGKIMLNKKYFKRVTVVYENRFDSGLSPEEIRLVETTWRSMKRNGAGLGWFKKFRIIAIQMKLSKLNLKFNENVLAETNKFELHITNETDLKGLPEQVIADARQTAKSKNKEGWVFVLQYPSYGPFMKYAQNRDLREKMYRAYTSRGNHGDKFDNNKLISRIVNLRLKQANLLGYETYADYVLEERMAETSENVNLFLKELHLASKPYAEKELNELKLFAKKEGLENELMPWDFNFYSEKLKTEKFGFDEEMVKPYFQLGKVINGVFALAKSLYGLTFKEVQDIPVYHPDVKTYEVYDDTGHFIAVFYADFHPREGKQGGAWMTEYRLQSNIEGDMIRPHISVCCNFTKPTEKTQSLLTFDEVTTFLHEFGHALHGMLANTVYPSLSGTNVYRDFVELPSQIMENWATETEWLNTFATHYETGEKMPPHLVEKLIAARNFQAGYQSERQLTYGMADMAWHSVSNRFNGNIIDFERNATAETQLFDLVEGSSISTAFSHIFAGGYAAGYYGYKWAEVLDADAFSVFKETGIFNKETASRFRTTVLEKGGTAHPMVLYKNFRGKEPTIDALLERSGLK